MFCYWKFPFQILIGNLSLSNERFSTNNTMQMKGRLSFESVGLLFEGATTNHFLSVVCAENTVDTGKSEV